MPAIAFSEKKSKVWKKMSSFGARIFVSTTIDGVLKKQQFKSILLNHKQLIHNFLNEKLQNFKNYAAKLE